ncbi:hypothetical protein Emag_003148 [Eimeria magna]
MTTEDGKHNPGPSSCITPSLHALSGISPACIQSPIPLNAEEAAVEGGLGVLNEDKTKSTSERESAWKQLLAEVLHRAPLSFTSSVSEPQDACACSLQTETQREACFDLPEEPIDELILFIVPYRHRASHLRTMMHVVSRYLEVLIHSHQTTDQQRHLQKQRQQQPHEEQQQDQQQQHQQQQQQRQQQRQQQQRQEEQQENEEDEEGKEGWPNGKTEYSFIVAEQCDSRPFHKST